MITDFARAVRADVAKVLQNEIESNGAGAARDWADYRYRVGLVNGLKRAQGVLDAQLNQLLHEDT